MHLEMVLSPEQAKISPPNEPTCSRILATTFSSLQERMKNVCKGFCLWTKKLWLQSVKQWLPVVPLYPRVKAQESTGGNSPIHQNPKCNINARPIWQVYPWVAPVYNIQGKKTEFSQVKTQWARWGPAQRARAPEFLPYAVTNLLWHCACHLITLGLISQITSGKKNYIYHWNLNANIKSALQLHLPRTNW